LDFLFFKLLEHQSNELRLSGESYVYVPYLDWKIDQYNALGGLKIKLKWFFFGNGVILNQKLNKNEQNNLHEIASKII
jgi:hypothetical protein